MKVKLFTFSLFLVLTALIFSTHVYADMGPKPTVKFYVEYENKKVRDDVFFARMLYCEDPRNPRYVLGTTTQLEDPLKNFSLKDEAQNCVWKPENLAWGGTCRNGQCSFSYMPPETFRLAVHLPSIDQTFVSNEVTRQEFHSTYTVSLKQDGSALIGEQKFNLRNFIHNNIFARALLITLAIELFLAAIFLSVLNLNKRILFSVILGTVLTLPVLWFITTLGYPGVVLPILLMAEIAIVFFEAALIFGLNKKYISFKKSLLLSTIINIASFVGGGFILFVSMMIF